MASQHCTEILNLVAGIDGATGVDETATANQPSAPAAAFAANKSVDVRIARGSEAKVHRLDANYVDITDNTDTPTHYLAGRAPVEYR